MAAQQLNQKSPFPPLQVAGAASVVSPQKPIASASAAAPLTFGAAVSASSATAASATAAPAATAAATGPINGYAPPLSQKQQLAAQAAAAASAAAAAQTVTATTGPESVLNFSIPLDVGVLDQIVQAFYIDGNKAVQPILVGFQNHPKSWTRVAQILEKSQNPNTKTLALITLEEAVKWRWNVLPQQQRDGIKTYLVNLVIKLSSDAKTLKDMRTFIGRANKVLVEVVKHEWPHRWPNFIKELVNSSKTSQTLCANNMNILLILSEEIFDYSAGHMTSAKVLEMKQNLNSEFTLIYTLCDYILANSQDPNLLSVTLKTLLRFLHWIPVGFIFETKLIPTLALKFFPVSQFQNDTLQCLAEIGGLDSKTVAPKDVEAYNLKFVQLFVSVTGHCTKLLTPETDVAKAYAKNSNIATFVRHLAIFITSFLKAHLPLLEAGDETCKKALVMSLTHLLRISKVDDVTIFKICLEYWSLLVVDLFNANTALRNATGSTATAAGGLNLLGGLGGLTTSKPAVSPRMQLYVDVLTHLRHVMIGKMAKPEEVLIVEDEFGQIVREQLKDTDSITLYKNMRECLIYLTNLDTEDTQTIMLAKLAKQMDGTEYTWNNLNTLCWAVGSISGSLSEQQEKGFLVKVIKDLLQLCETKRGKDHKAVVASNIMYVVGQYPRFLRQHWKFLRTVVTKLFEFMHEKHPGVQDMSVDTFLKIAKSCRRKFVTVQPAEQPPKPFIEDILDNLHTTIRDLEPSQVLTFYEACSTIIGAQTQPDKRQVLVFKLMDLPNQLWTQIIAKANQSTDVLWRDDTVKHISMVLRTNVRVAGALGTGYMVQLARIYLEMLQVYKMYSTFISKKIQTDGAAATATVGIRHMRGVKKEVLRLVQNFIAGCADSDKEVVYKQFLPPLIDPVLDDYKRNVPDARDSEVLSLFATVVEKLGAVMVPHAPKIFECVFQVTLAMITKNFEDFMDHRLSFFKLLRAINSHAFGAMLRLNSQQFQLVMDSILWAMKHLERNIADTGLNILLEIISNVSTSEVCNDFFKTYFISLLQDLLGVMFDSFHKPNFRLQSMILARMFNIVDTGLVTVPLWKTAPTQFPNNQTYVRVFVCNLLATNYKNLSKPQIEAFVAGLFKHNSDVTKFKEHLRDFMVELKGFGKADADLFLEERQRKIAEAQQKEQMLLMQVPGLIKGQTAASGV